MSVTSVHQDTTTTRSVNVSPTKAVQRRFHQHLYHIIKQLYHITQLVCVCEVCGCSSVGTLPEVCDASGHCLCKPEFDGPRCEQCKSGFHSYPNCQGRYPPSRPHAHARRGATWALFLAASPVFPVCTCDPHTSLDISCTTSGHCRCQPNYSGASCDQCAPGYYGYPSCTRTCQRGEVTGCSVVEPGKFLERIVCFVQPASVLQRVRTTAVVTVSPVSVFVELAWSDAGVTRARRDRMASPAVKVIMPTPSTRAERGATS